MQFTHLLTAILWLFLSLTLTAQSFEKIDSTFGENGIFIPPATCDLGVVQPDGKIVFFGSIAPSSNTFADFLAFSRFEADGRVDTDFGINGTSFIEIPDTNSFITQLYMQPDGKFLAFVFKSKRAVMVPDYHYMWMRFHADGTLDKQFGTNGSLALNHQNPITHGVLQSDGKVVLTGYIENENEQSTIFVERYNADGSLDITFGEQGRFRTQEWQYEAKPTAIALTKEQDILITTKVLAADWNSSPILIVSRIQPNGQLDINFGEAGTVIFSEYGMIDGKLMVQEDKKILLLANLRQPLNQDFLLARLLPDGSFDTSFGKEGQTIINTHQGITEFGIYIDNATDFILQKDQSILVTGSVSNASDRTPTIYKFSPDGQLDTSFGTNGLLSLQFEGDNGSISSISEQFDNQLLIQAISDKTYGRNNRLFLQRYLMDFNVGIFNPVLSAEELLVYPNPIQQAATLKYSLANPENITIQLVDIKGKVLTTYLENQAQVTGHYQQPIDLPTYLSTGVYFLTIRSPRGQVAVKVRK